MSSTYGENLKLTIFGKSPVVLATIIAVILNLILPKSSKSK